VNLADKIIRPSTRAFVRAARSARDYSTLDWLHGYVYARWPYLYIGVGTGEHRLARLIRPVANFLSRWVIPPDGDGRQAFADTYHGKVVPLAAARQLVTVNEDVELLDLEQVIPYALARDIVLRHPDHIAVLDCPCRAARPNPCTPLDVCLLVGEPFASFAVEHHPRRARWITQGEAEEILIAEHRRGHVAHAFFKDAMLGRFYAICNCCTCCCGAMQAWRDGTPMLAPSGYVAIVDVDLCSACGLCVDRCPFGALVLDHDQAKVDWTACMGCGVCVPHCPQEAISLRRDPAKGEPLEIHELVGQTAVDGPQLP
jgi:Pyruvate/2-oxoacid:ferredoxin oxidoreductase delta subunit